MTVDRPAEPAKRLLVQLRPDLRARAPHQESDRFARVAERQDKQPRALVFAGGRVAHHRPLAVIDLGFLARRRRDDDPCLGHGRLAQTPDEAADARVPGGEAMVIDQVLPDRHRVAPARERVGDHLAVDLAGTGTGRTGGCRSRWTPPKQWPDLSAGRWTPPATKWPLLPALRSVGPGRARAGQRLAGTRPPFRGARRSPLRSDGATTPNAPRRRCRAASACPRRCSSGRGTLRPTSSSTSQPPSVNGRF